jgi:pimeloyl-ACP methyl ester carboxylesterase
MKSCFLLGLALILATNAALAQRTNQLSAEAARQIRLPDVALDSVAPAGSASDKDLNRGGYLDVKGVIGGTIRFEVLLPSSWNGRFVMGGGGGFVGTVQGVSRDLAGHGYVSAGTDTGHESQPGYLAGWAQDNLEAQLDFGYLGVHRTAEVAKALIRACYGVDPVYSYFIGCSRGGGQAMMEAQRYPNDFNGIVAGAPAFNWPGLAATMVGIAQALYPDPTQLDHTVLTKATLQKLQQSILEQCDAQDGLRDGIIADPASTHFDLAKVPDLTDAERRAIQAIYTGANHGQSRIYPGFAPVAECDPDQWIAWLVGPVAPLVSKDHVPDLTFAFGTQIFKYLVFNNPDWNYATYTFAHFDQDTRLAASFLNATNPNLDGLKARQGKLILWHGWADPALPTQATIDYYRQVQARDPEANQYARLFLVPGCLHCGGGPGATEVDWLGAIVDWVELAQAPDRLIAARRENGKVVLSRPLYPYPQVALYDGSGDPARADSFKPKPGPRTPP